MKKRIKTLLTISLTKDESMSLTPEQERNYDVLKVGKTYYTKKLTYRVKCRRCLNVCDTRTTDVEGTVKRHDSICASELPCPKEKDQAQAEPQSS